MRDQHIHALLRASRETQADELDCEDFLTAMAQYAELRALASPLPESWAKVEAHERLCANCAEECRALVDLLQSEPKGE